jgi:very-short-patch-repair endonuclease
MKHVHWQGLAAEQDDLVARWQLLRSAPLWAVEETIRRADWRTVHDGVYATNHAPITERQRLRGATLTAPNTYLAAASAAHVWGVRTLRRHPFAVVVRPGDGGPRRFGDVLVRRSRRLEGWTTTHRGIPITTIERTLIDLAVFLGPRALARAVREALRLGLTTPARLAGATLALPGARGARRVRLLALRYAGLDLHRSRSDAESFAQELIAAAGLTRPDINRLVAGEEADLIFRAARVIIEIDGPQFHRFPDDDLRKQEIWEKAGWTVLRISSDDVYDRPERLLALVPR